MFRLLGNVSHPDWFIWTQILSNNVTMFKVDIKMQLFL